MMLKGTLKEKHYRLRKSASEIRIPAEATLLEHGERIEALVFHFFQTSSRLEFSVNHAFDLCYI